jgi:PAS domain S-box-containing protein
VSGSEVRRARQRPPAPAPEQPRIKYRDLLEGVGAAIYALDLEGKFIYVNARALDLLGYEARELVGQHFRKIVTEEHLDVAQQLFARGREVRPLIIQVVRKDGRPVTVEVSGAWVRRRTRRVAALAMAWELNAAAPVPPAGHAEALSKLDLTILQLISDGLSNREIAERVYLSSHTIKDRVERIMRTFGASRRAELAAKAARQGLV